MNPSAYLGVWTFRAEERSTGVARVADGLHGLLTEVPGLDVSGITMTKNGRHDVTGIVSVPFRPIPYRMISREVDLKRAVKEWLQRLPPGSQAIVHCHDAIQAATCFDIVGNRATKVYSVYSLIEEETMARTQDQSLGGQMRRSAILSLLPKYERRAVNLADVVHCLSEYTAMLCRVRYKPVEPRVLPHWIPTFTAERADKTVHLLKVGAPVVCIRRLEPRTGVDMALRAWMDEEAADLPQLLVAGTGSLEEALREMTSSSSDHIKMLGWVSDEKLLSLYETASVNLMPTRAEEGFGLPILEAAAFGVPTVGFNVGAIPEMLALLGCPDTFLARPGDLQDLQRAVRSALDWPDEERASVAMRVRHVFSSETLLPAYLRMFGVETGPIASTSD